MIWRLLLAVLSGYLLFVAYRFYAHSQPVTAIDIRQQHIAQTDTLQLAVVWPEGEDKKGYIRAVGLMVDRINQQGLAVCAEPAVQDDVCRQRTLLMRYYPEATGGQDDAVQQARKVVANPNTLAVLGYYRSDMAVPAATVYEHNGVLMLSSGATNVKFTSYDFRYIFRHVANDNNNAEVLAKHLHEEGYINVYVIYERDLYGTDFSNYFIEHVTARGLKVPAQVFYEEHENDYLPILASLRSKISSINLTDEVALLQAKLEQLKRIERIRLLATQADDSLIVQFLTEEQQQKKGSNKFFDSMPRIKLLDYLQLELEQSAASTYLQQLFVRNQQEMSVLSADAQFAQLELLELDIGLWAEELKSVITTSSLPAQPSGSLQNHRIVTRKALDFGFDDTEAQLSNMLKRIGRVKSGQVDAIFIAGFMPQAAQVIRQARSLSLDLPIFGGHSLLDLSNNCSKLNNCASYGDVSVLISHNVEEYRQVFAKVTDTTQASCADDKTDCIPERYNCPEFVTAYSQFQDFAQAYQKKYQQIPDNWAVQGYLAASIVQHTIAAAHTFDPEVLADTLLYQGSSEFTDKGLMFSCSSSGSTEGDVLVDGMKIRKLGNLQ